MGRIATTKTLAVFRYDKLICVTAENSESHLDFLAKNEQIIDDLIASHKKPYDDAMMIKSNYSYEAWRHCGETLEEFVKQTLIGHLHRFIVMKEGIEGLMAVIDEKCTWDSYKFIAVRAICKRNPDTNYKHLFETITDREIFREVSGDAHLYTFKEVEYCD